MSEVKMDSATCVGGAKTIVAAIVARSFLFAISRGLPAWDAAWATDTPPRLTQEETAVKDLIGYVRPTIIGYAKEDPAGSVFANTGGKRYSSTEDVTGLFLARVDIPPDAFPGQTVREIGLFEGPTIAADVLPGQMVIPTDKVTDAGNLFHLSWFQPQPLSAQGGPISLPVIIQP